MMQLELRPDFMQTSRFARWMYNYAPHVIGILEDDVKRLLQIIYDREGLEDRRRLEGAAESAARVLGMAMLANEDEAVLVFQSALSLIHDSLDRIYMSEEG